MPRAKPLTYCDGKRATCNVLWHEHDGPPVLPSSREGLASKLIAIRAERRQGAPRSQAGRNRMSHQFRGRRRTDAGCGARCHGAAMTWSDTLTQLTRFARFEIRLATRGRTIRDSAERSTACPACCNRSGPLRVNFVEWPRCNSRLLQPKQRTPTSGAFCSGPTAVIRPIGCAPAKVSLRRCRNTRQLRGGKQLDRRQYHAWRHALFTPVRQKPPNSEITSPCGVPVVRATIEPSSICKLSAACYVPRSITEAS
jgi:hypothetical protein